MINMDIDVMIVKLSEGEGFNIIYLVKVKREIKIIYGMK